MDTRSAHDAAHTRPAAWPYWLAGTAGLLILITGLAADRWWMALAGFVVMGMSHTVHQRRRGRGANDGGAYYGGDGRNDHYNDADGDGDDSDGGGESGGDGGGD